MSNSVRKLVLASCAVFICGSLCVADDAAKAQQLIDRGIKAIGGKAALEKSRNTVMEDNGTYFGMGQGLPYKGRYVYQYGNPGRYRMEITGVFVTVLNGDKAWMEAMGNVSDIDGEALEVTKQAYFVGYVLSLLPLQKPDKAFKLSMAPSDAIEGEDCDGIQIEHEQMPTLTVYFSKETGLIKKTAYTAKVAELGFQEALEEVVFHEYKEFDGVMSTTSFTSYRDGKKFIEANPHNVTFPDTIDVSEFKRPE